MNEAPIWKTPKWPFWSAYLVLMAIGFAVVFRAEHPISHAVMYVAVACAGLGSLLGCLPYLLDYLAVGKLIEVNAVGTVVEQLQDLQKCSAQIAAATDRWALVQETTKGNTDKTVAAAKEVADRMTEEIHDFNEFQIKLNDTEKGALRLEVEKLRRGEGEWLQVVARILDNVFALHNAAARSGNAELAEQIGSFQLSLFNAAPDEKFDPQKHRAHGVENPPADAVIAETLAAGMTFQGRLVRQALVKLHEAAAEKPEAAAPDQLALDAD
jgi:hypothetical protein